MINLAKNEILAEEEDQASVGCFCHLLLVQTATCGQSKAHHKPINLKLQQQQVVVKIKWRKQFLCMLP